MLNKILLRKIKFPLSLRGLFPFCHSRESGNPSYLSLRGAKQRSNLSGFSLIELMVAITILAMAIFGIFHAYSVGFMGMADARDRTVATNYAQEAMEDIKNMDFKEISSTDPTLIEGTKFEREIQVVDNVEGSPNLKQVTTTVRWDDRNGIPKFEVKLETLIYNND
ncbi:prepilin-type N-terminal cleavage/methylation domain-containing protein [bacterium]|nr:prepilin-type N-terminal cleavage/methylation domain-containing protein [bacterium]